MTLYGQVKEFLLDEIENYEDFYEYGCDIAYLVTSEINSNGTVEFSTKGTIEKITDNFEEYGSVFEYMQDNFGEVINPFNNPERFDVQAYIIIAGQILSQVPIIQKNWNEQFILTEEIIKQIQQHIEDDKGDYFEY